MKPDKKQFIERLLKLSYHAHRIEITIIDNDKQKYLDMLLVRDNSRFLYDQDTETKEDN